MLITCAILDRAGIAPRVCCATCHDLADVGGLRTLIPDGRNHVTVTVCCDRHRAILSRYADSADGMSRNAWSLFVWDVKLGMESEP